MSTAVRTGVAIKGGHQLVARAERQAQVVALRRDQRMTVRAIAEQLGCCATTVCNDLHRYLAKLDKACLDGAAALRAEQYERLDELSAVLMKAVAEGDLSQIPAAIKTSESIRKLYALDVQPLGRSELSLRRAVISEIATKLRDNLPPEVFAEVASCLVSDEQIELINGVAIPSGDEAAAPAAIPHRAGSRLEGGPGAPAAEQLDA